MNDADDSLLQGDNHECHNQGTFAFLGRHVKWTLP